MEGTGQEMATTESEGGGTKERGEGETEEKAPTEHQETGGKCTSHLVMTSGTSKTLQHSFSKGK